MTGTRKKWLTVEPLMNALTAWARRLIAGTANGSPDIGDTDDGAAPPEQDDEIIIGPVGGH